MLSPLVTHHRSSIGFRSSSGSSRDDREIGDWSEEEETRTGSHSSSKKHDLIPDLGSFLKTEEQRRVGMD